MNAGASIPQHALAMATMGIVGMYYVEHVLREQERKQLEIALDTWESEGGSGPSVVEHRIPAPPDSARLRCTPGNGRWRHDAFFEDHDLFVVLDAAAKSEDAAVSVKARELLAKWGWV